MANQITDQRTLLFDGGDGTGGAPDDLTGAAAGTTDTSTFIESATSYTYSQSNARDGLLFDAGSAQDYSNNTFWLWANSGVVGLMLAKASGGFTVRFCGATVTDFFEVYVGGNDSWPVTYEGGWAMFVVDIEEASANPSNTGGTAPGTNAIRYVGISCNLSIMPKMADNTWLDAIWRNPTASPAWIVEGRNGGSTDWDMDDVAAQLGIGSGLAIPTSGGSITMFGPGQFGINDTTTHGFTSTNDILLWADQEFILDGFYKLSALGNSGGTTNVTFGAKTGTGDDATGAQGAVIAGDSTLARWDMDFNDPDLDLVAFYGCSLQGSGDLLLDDPACSFISTLFIDGDTALVSNAEILRCSVIAAATADGVAYMTTDDLSDIVFSNFEFSDGHGVELTTPRVATQASKGNQFVGYGTTTSNDAAVFNDTAGAVTINVTDGGSDITYRDGTSASTTISLSPVTLTIHVVRLDTGADRNGSRVLVTCVDPGPNPYQDSVTIVQSGGTATVTHTTHGLITGDDVLITGATNDERYNGVKSITVTTANAYTFTIDSGVASPATGTIVATLALIHDVTAGAGVIADTRVYSSDQDYEGRVRDSSGTPIFKTSPILTATLDSGTDKTVDVGLILDE